MKLDLADAFDAVFDPAEGDDSPGRPRWYAEIDGDEVGPLSLAEVGRCVEQGRVFPDTQVWRKGMATWSPAQSIPEIDALFAAPPLPAQPRVAVAPPRPTAAALAALVDAELRAPIEAATPPSLLLMPGASSSDSAADVDTLASLMMGPPPAVLAAAPAVPARGRRTPLVVAAGVGVAALIVGLAAAVVVVSRPAPGPELVWRGGAPWLRDPAGRLQPLRVEVPVAVVAPTPAPPAPAPVLVAPAPAVPAPPAPPTSTPPQHAATPPTHHAPPVRPPAPTPPPSPAAPTSCDRELGLGCGAATTDREVLSQGDVLVVARKNLPSVRTCAARFGATGLARMGWRVLANGAVADARVLDGNIAGTPLGACLTGAVNQWRFPTSTKDTVVKSLPLPLK